MDSLSTEYLIMHEHEIDWESLSRDSSRSFSLPEIRMFRKKINWCEYMKSHDMSPNDFEVASKHFGKSEYDMIALLNLAPEEFIENHRDKFNWEIVLRNCMVSPKMLMECFSCWKNIPKEKLQKLLCENKLIDLSDSSFDEINLFIGLKN